MATLISRRRAAGGRRFRFRRLFAFERLESRELLSATYYVDPAGRGGTPSDAYAGTSVSQPLADLATAIAKAGPGDTIVLRTPPIPCPLCPPGFGMAG